MQTCWEGTRRPAEPSTALPCRDAQKSHTPQRRYPRSSCVLSRNSSTTRLNFSLRQEFGSNSALLFIEDGVELRPGHVVGVGLIAHVYGDLVAGHCVLEVRGMSMCSSQAD